MNKRLSIVCRARVLDVCAASQSDLIYNVTFNFYSFQNYGLCIF